MSDINEKCLEIFPAWLASLPEDVGTILSVLKAEGISDDAKRTLIGSLNYLFKSLDLIPDEVDDLGYLDDAFVLRLSAQNALAEGLGNVPDDAKAKLESLSKSAAIIEEFLTADVLKRLRTYVDHLRTGAARGRMVEELIDKPALFAELVDETESFIADFKVPNFNKDEKNLIKLAAFFDARLPK